jgi:hypothetical protein
MRLIKVLVVAVAGLMIIACSKDEPADIKVVFVEQEPGVEPYQTRLIVTSDFMRFDDGEGSVDFVLFDRKKQVIYSTNSGERTVMSVIAKQTEDVKPPFELKQAVKNLGALKDAPRIQDKAPLHYQFLTNDSLCYEVIAVKGLMPEVVEAMREFQTILASDSKLTFHTIPADMHNACDMSMTTFSAGRHLEYGFPVQEWTPTGTGRTLIDFDVNYKADKNLFVLPADYQLYSVQDYREGRVKFE